MKKKIKILDKVVKLPYYAKVISDFNEKDYAVMAFDGVFLQTCERQTDSNGKIKAHIIKTEIIEDINQIAQIFIDEYKTTKEAYQEESKHCLLFGLVGQIHHLGL